MTNEQVKQGFAEVYNGFWCRYKDRVPGKHSPEWKRMYSRYVALKEEYPFMGEALGSLAAELDRRMREGKPQEDGYQAKQMFGDGEGEAELPY